MFLYKTQSSAKRRTDDLIFSGRSLIKMKNRTGQNLQVTRTYITSQTSSKFGKIGPRTAELAALERLEKSP